MADVKKIPAEIEKYYQGFGVDIDIRCSICGLSLIHVWNLTNEITLSQIDSRISHHFKHVHPEHVGGKT